MQTCGAAAPRVVPPYLPFLVDERGVALRLDVKENRISNKAKRNSGKYS